ncbi:MAG: hypothetical protein WBP58_15340 [Chitinophagaceae bacterium]
MAWALLFVLAGKSQTNTALSLTNLPLQGVVLNDGWVFLEEDSAQFASTGYDDRHWKTIDPAKDIFTISNLPHAGKIFWLR